MCGGHLPRHLWAYTCACFGPGCAQPTTSRQQTSWPAAGHVQECGFEKAGGKGLGVTACWWLSSSRSPGQGKGMHSTSPGSWRPGQLGPGIGSGAGAGGGLSGRTPAQCWP